MRGFIVCLAFFLSLGPGLLRCTVGSGSEGGGAPKKPYAEGQILVKFKRDVTPQRIARINAEMGTEVIKEMGRLMLIRIPKGASVEKMLKRFSSLPEVEYAQPDYIQSIH